MGAILEPTRRHIAMFISIFVVVSLSRYVVDQTAHYQPEPVGGLILAALITGSLVSMRRRVLRHYATCDLISGARPTRLL
jgi:Na+-transporting NADH:ubiquinone oxidoreductase subunit NqrD